MTHTTELSHLSTRGGARMVDVSKKAVTSRTAIAEAWIDVGAAVAAILRKSGRVPKGNVLETARTAAILAAKSTPSLIPMCHPLVLDVVEVNAELVDQRVCIQARVSCQGKTGVEMEAMVAAAVGALTVYDMVKSVDKGLTIGPVRLLSKAGGKSGRWRRQAGDHASRGAEKERSIGASGSALHRRKEGREKKRG